MIETLRRYGGAALGLSLLLLPASVPAAGWDREVAAQLEEAIEQAPGSRLHLAPGEQLVYRIETRLDSPKIPLFSDRGTIVLTSTATFSATGLDAEGYDFHLSVAAETSDAELGEHVQPYSTGWLRLDHHATPLPRQLPRGEPAWNNAANLFRDLRAFAGSISEVVDQKWTDYYPSKLKLGRLRTETRYEDAGIDPETGNRRVRMDVREHASERRRKRGFVAEGEAAIAPDGVLQHATLDGRIWKKVFLFNISVPTTYEIRLVERRAPDRIKLGD